MGRFALIWDGCADNESFCYSVGNKAAVDKAFDQADHVTRLKIAFNRVTAAIMEPRGCIADYDSREDRYTLYAGTQRPHMTRHNIEHKSLGLPEAALRVVAGDVGGSFGMKNEHYPEYGLCLWAARRVGRPVKWVSDRSEAIASDDHDRDHVCDAALALDPETGTTEVLRYTVVDDVGTVINELTLEGQIHGGIGQAFGQAFGEHLQYDVESGQLLTGSFLDYGMPRADQMCAFEMESRPVPTRTNPLGVKGAGEAGNVGALPAIMNAVVDALSPLGVADLDMPATPCRVWHAIQAATTR